MLVRVRMLFIAGLVLFVGMPSEARAGLIVSDILAASHRPSTTPNDNLSASQR